MEFEELGIEGAWVFTPRQHTDPRGTFLEWYRHEVFSARLGHPLDLAQANCSVSRAGTVRGVHFADVPVGQAKYVTCVSGAVIDVIVDLRVGSPSFGRWEAVRLDDETRRAVYLAEGLGHAFAALEDGATVIYLCSAVYNPAAEHAIHPLDPDLAIDWAGLGVPTPLLSTKDAAAPGLASVRAQGGLPDVRICLQYRQSLASGAPVTGSTRS